MIKVVVKKENNDYIKCLEVSGHANYAKHGEDIVCAGVSAVIVGGLNALDKLSNKKLIKAVVKDGYVKIDVLKQDQDTKLILQTIMVQLESIEESYSQFVKIIRQGG
jgi:uncharacterized protein YsxB (DUF464 family)